MTAHEEITADATPWERTLDQLDSMAEELREEGLAVVAIRAGHVAPEAPESGDTDRFGYVFTIPGDGAVTFEETFQAASLTEYQVFRRTVDGTLFLIVSLIDPGETAILLAGGVDLARDEGMIEAARERGEMYTHVQLLDWTHLGSVRHDDPEPFLPDAPA